MTRALPVFLHPDDEIDVTSDFGTVWVEIGPIHLSIPNLDVAAQLENAFLQARALLEPADEKAAMADAMEAA